MASLRLSIRNDIADFAATTPKVISFLEDRGVPTAAAYAVRVAVEELVVNVIRHGFDDAFVHAIDVEISLEEGFVVVRIEDDGRAFDPRGAAVPDLSGTLAERAVGGWGIHLVRSLCDRLTYERRSGRNCVAVYVVLEPRDRLRG